MRLINHLEPSGDYSLRPQRIHVFGTILRINSDYFLKQS
jgi:hypothetical protein